LQQKKWKDAREKMGPLLYFLCGGREKKKGKNLSILERTFGVPGKKK